MVRGWEQFPLGNLKTLMRCATVFAKEYLDRILTAGPGVADRHQIIAHGMQAQVEDWRKPLIATHLARADFASYAIHCLAALALAPVRVNSIKGVLRLWHLPLRKRLQFSETVVHHRKIEIGIKTIAQGQLERMDVRIAGGFWMEIHVHKIRDESPKSEVLATQVPDKG